MANAKGSTNLRNTGPGGKIPLLPPKCPFPVPSPSYADYSLNPSMGHKVIPKSKEGNASHQRTSSEGFLVDEQPSWLDDLLNEPDTPVRRGHRRSSSDSFAYIDVASMAGTDYVPLLPDERKRNAGLDQLWGSQKLNQYNHVLQGSFSADLNTYAKPGNRPWELPSRSCTHFLGISPSGDHSISQGSVPLSIRQERGRFSYAAAEKQESGESSLHETKAFQEKKDVPHGKMLSENDTKNAKQKFAQRSRVRKLQYIAELERNVQAMQAEGSDVSAELEFVNQQHLILSMENKALKQRLESLAQEHLIKRLEHEVLEREIGRLRAVYQLQKQQGQQPPQQLLHHQRQSSSNHRRSRSIDLDARFSSLSLKHREAGSGNDSVRT